MKEIKGGVCAAKGFKAGGIHAGIKASPDSKDLAMIYCETQCNATALYTTNKVKAAPVKVTEKNLSDLKAQAIIVNSGNANACVANGLEIAEKMCGLTAKSLNIDSRDVVVASTGVIGQPLEITPFESGIPALVEALSYDGSDNAVEAIMTTDTFAKQTAVEFEFTDGTKCRVGGIAKGSGMINPNMATMLAFITTDVNIAQGLLKKALTEVNAKTFNMVSVDGDTSTNDMVCIMASGLAGNGEIIETGDDYAQFIEALHSVMRDLAKKMARDGEGATKLIECVVDTADNDSVAGAIAKSVISSSLVKAALGAADANWGRILCAIGYADGGFDIGRVDVVLESSKGTVTVCKNGSGVAFSEEKAFEILSEDEIKIHVSLNSGGGNSQGYAVAWGCDLTQEYVRINADYRS